jgi:glycosyltransferase involved in cell wall biosynthesis
MRLLVVTRYYPPEVSGGARRPKALVEGLRAAGVDVTLCGPSGIEDENFIDVSHPSFPAVPSDVGTSGDVPASKGLADWARRHLLLPDPEIRWALRVVARIKASGQKYDWVLTTSPPESLHVAGALLKRHLGCKWVADVRDMWIRRPQRRELENSAFRRWIETRIARATLGQVDALVAVSQAVMDEVSDYTSASVPKTIIGHFSTPFAGAAEALPDATFNIVHTGAITLSNPLSQFSALLADFGVVAKNRPEAVLWLAGNLTVSEQAAIASATFSTQIRMLGPVSMERARALQLAGDALALVSGEASHALPGKFSEYAQTGKPILISAPGPWVELIPKDAPVYQFIDAASWTETPPSEKITVFDSGAAAAQLLKLLSESA